MAKSVRVTVKDRGYEALMKRLRSRGARVTVGVHDDAPGTEEGGQSPAEVLAYHEFGLGVPRRSVVADWFDENEPAHAALMREAAAAVVKGTFPNLEAALQNLGAKLEGSMRARLLAGIDPPLDDKTAEQAGHTIPLVEDGTILEAIRHKVDGGGPSE